MIRWLVPVLLVMTCDVVANDASCYLGPGHFQPPTGEPTYDLGSTPNPERLRRWDIDVSPNGDGLPGGRGTVAEGGQIYAAQCAACHGADGRGGVNDALVGGDGNYIRDRGVPKTVGNYWPYATTLFDYIRRAMPFTAPGSLSDSEVYAVTGYVLFLNGYMKQTDSLDAQALLSVQLPGAARLRRYDECKSEDP